jgi:hypothetical protein
MDDLTNSILTGKQLCKPYIAAIDQLAVSKIKG